MNWVNARAKGSAQRLFNKTNRPCARSNQNGNERSFFNVGSKSRNACNNSRLKHAFFNHPVNKELNHLLTQSIIAYYTICNRLNNLYAFRLSALQIIGSASCVKDFFSFNIIGNIARFV